MQVNELQARMPQWVGVVPYSHIVNNTWGYPTDCSGFVSWALEAGSDVKAYEWSAEAFSTPIDTDELRYGDIVTHVWDDSLLNRCSDGDDDDSGGSGLGSLNLPGNLMDDRDEGLAPLLSSEVLAADDASPRDTLRDTLLAGGQPLDEEDEQVSPRVTLWAGASAAKRRLLLCGYAVLATQWTLMTVMSSFMPLSPPAIIFSSEVTGVIFACFPLGVAVSAPFVGRFLRRFGSRAVLTYGCVLMAIFIALFGAVPLAVSGRAARWPFMAAAFLYGATSALAESGVYAVLECEFRETLGELLATTEVAAGAGAAIGPFMGGALYDAFAGASDEVQFFAPFAVAAALPLAGAVAVQLCVPGLRAQAADALAIEERAKRESRELALEQMHAEAAESARRLVLAGGGTAAAVGGAGGSPEPAAPGAGRAGSPPRSPWRRTEKVYQRKRLLAVPFFVTVLSSICGSALGPTLEKRTAAPPFGMSSMETGMLYLAASVTYMAASVPIGRAIDAPRRKYTLPNPLMAGGLVVLALSFLLAGPVRGLRSALDNYPVLVFATLLQGVGWALTVVPTLPAMMVYVPKNDELAASSTTGLWVSAYAVGSAIGPLLGAGLISADLGVLCDVAEGGAGETAAMALAAQEAHCFDGFAVVMAMMLVVALLLLAGYHHTCVADTVRHGD
eukprot:g7737.t1